MTDKEVNELRAAWHDLIHAADHLRAAGADFLAQKVDLHADTARRILAAEFDARFEKEQEGKK